MPLALSFIFNAYHQFRFVECCTDCVGSMGLIHFHLFQSLDLHTPIVITRTRETKPFSKVNIYREKIPAPSILFLFLFLLLLLILSLALFKSFRWPAYNVRLYTLFLSCIGRSTFICLLVIFSVVFFFLCFSFATYRSNGMCLLLAVSLCVSDVHYVLVFGYMPMER